MIPSVSFFRGICFQLYGGVAWRRQTELRVNAAAEPALVSSCPRPRAFSFTSKGVPNEKADRSPDACFFRRRRASCCRADPIDARPCRDRPGGLGQAGEVQQEAEQEAQEGKQGQDRAEELSTARGRTGRATPGKAGPPAFLFWSGYNRLKTSPPGPI